MIRTTRASSAISARDKGFKVLVAMRGTEALALAREFHPTAVSLDVFLPDMLGWTVLNHLKQDPATRHIPVQMLTARRGPAPRPLARRVRLCHQADHHAKAWTRRSTGSRTTRAPRRKRLLVVEDEPAEQLSIRELLGYDDIDVDVVSTGEEALAAVKNESFDCVVLDLRLPDMTGFECWNSCSDIQTAAICRSSSSLARISRRKKMRNCTRWRAASS